MNNSKKILYVRNVDENLQSIINDFKKKFKSKSEAKVVRRMINDFPLIVDFSIKTANELEELKKELKKLKEEKNKVLEILNNNS